MKLFAPFVLLAAVIAYAEASQGHHAGLSRISTHHHIAQRNGARALDSNATNVNKKRARCKPRPAAPAPQNNAVQSEPPQAPEVSKAAQSSKAPDPTRAPEPNKAQGSKPASTPVSPPPAKNDDKPANDDNKPSNTPSVGGVIKVGSDQCGASGATPQSSATDGPNGRLDWLNCGLDAGGWNPPHVTPQDLVTKSLSDAVNQPNSAFAACKPYLSAFENYANQHGLPPILIASIAMQESSCNPNAVGGGGEQGLMQITKEKCVGAPGGNCRDTEFNIRIGVEFFAKTLADSGNNVLLTMGRYNGWFQGLTIAKATAARNSACCLCQNNLDYLHQVFNAWVLGISPPGNFGKYHNLQVCGGGH